MKVIVKHMGGDNGYYYIQIEGTDFVLARKHPEFLDKFDNDEKGRQKALDVVQEVNQSIS